jgi:hypothetical protein
MVRNPVPLAEIFEANQIVQAFYLGPSTYHSQPTSLRLTSRSVRNTQHHRFSGHSYLSALALDHVDISESSTGGVEKLLALVVSAARFALILIFTDIAIKWLFN